MLLECLPEYVDAWPCVRGTDAPGHTFDGATNPHVADPDECMRYDRVMLRRLAPLSIDMLGARAGEATTVVTPSDHYGLSCAVRFAPRSDQ